MIRCVVLEEFTLEKFDELKNIKRVNVDTYGRLYVNDEFECNEDMAKYLTGGNDKGKVVVKIVEVPVKLKSEAKTIEKEVFEAKVVDSDKVGVYPIKPKKKLKKDK